MAVWVQYQGMRFDTTKEFLASIAELPDAVVYQCAYDIAFGRDLIGERNEYPVGDPHRAAWRRRFAAAGINPRRGDECFEQALAIAKEISFPPLSSITWEELKAA